MKPYWTANVRVVRKKLPSEGLLPKYALFLLPECKGTVLPLLTKLLSAKQDPETLVLFDHRG
jgi:hypothetical protein